MPELPEVEAWRRTLDPLVRRVKLHDRRELLISDTGGFIDRLPHALVAAFRLRNLAPCPRESMAGQAPNGGR